MKPPSVLLAVLLTILASVTQADVIYDNGGPDFGNAFGSDFDWPVALADDFTLAVDATVITAVHWWGIYWAVPSIMDNFTVSLYESIGGSPASTSLVDYTGGSVIRTATGDMLAGRTLYAYSMDISPLTLSANTTYVISIVNDSVDNTDADNWLWAGGSQLGDGSSYFRRSVNDPWSSQTTELAFNLTYDNLGGPVPEPATLSLLSMGLAGLALRTRRRKA